MKKSIFIIIFISIVLCITSCGIYSFSGGNTGDAKTLQIDFFKNEAPLIQPGINQTFTQNLQDLFTRQTNLTLVKNNGDLHFNGEITDFRVNPISATSNQTAAQNRLTITINVRFVNKLKEEDDFEKEFSFYADFNGNQNPQGSVLNNLVETIFERITQDIFNASVAKW